MLHQGLPLCDFHVFTEFYFIFSRCSDCAATHSFSRSGAVNIILEVYRFSYLFQLKYVSFIWGFARRSILLLIYLYNVTDPYTKQSTPPSVSQWLLLFGANVFIVAAFYIAYCTNHFSHL
jgi:hypothetical protein